MGEELQPAVPALQPPLLEVGYNYTWPFNRYGTTIGPRDLENDPPTGAHDSTPVFRNTVDQPPDGSLARNLDILKNGFNIRKVRIFLLGNLYNYGKQPLTGVTPSGRSFFEAPNSPSPLFFDHFRSMLEVFRDKGMQIIPSLLDFGAIYPRGSGAGGGRTSITSSQRAKFLETMVYPLVAVSSTAELRDTIFAWEAINEPFWNISSSYMLSRPHTASSGPDLDESVMATFIQDILNIFQNAGFATTVGHRFLSDLTDTLPVGSKPQFHYYSLILHLPDAITHSDPKSIPTFASLANDSRTKNAFVGEIHSAVDRPWDDCHGTDNTTRTASFERLKVLCRKGYKLAFVWPDLPDTDNAVVTRDALKLSADAQASVKQFTKGLFPGGIP